MAAGLKVGASSLDASAIAQMDSTTKGALIPRMTTAQRDLISAPATGLLVWNTTTARLEEYSGGAWRAIGTGASFAPTDATYLTQTANGTLSAEQALASLATGLMKVTTTTGVVESVTTSAGVAALLSDETGSGALVFGTGPTIGTPSISGGTINNNVIGGVTPVAGTFTTLTGTKLLFAASTELTIATGAVTATQTVHTIDTEADAASDDLDTISGGTANQILILRADNTARTVVLTTAGNIVNPTAASITLDETYKEVWLKYDAALSKWIVVFYAAGSGTNYQTVKNNGSAATQRAALNLIPGTNITFSVSDDAGNNETDFTINATSTPGGGASPAICEGRLTLTSGTAITTSDVTAAGTLYFTPYNGNRIGLYSGSAWAISTFSELSLALTLTDATNYDVFLDDDATTLSVVAWTNATTRATALVLQDGIAVKSGDTTKRYLGTIRASGTNTTEDSLAKRFVFNAYHRRQRPMKVIETTDSWTYGTASWRAANNSTANKVSYVCGLSEDPVEATVNVRITNGAGSVGIGVDSSTANSAQLFTDINVSLAVMNSASYQGFPGIGYHDLYWIEYGRVATVSFFGDAGIPTSNQGGLVATVWA